MKLIGHVSSVERSKMQSGKRPEHRRFSINLRTEKQVAYSTHAYGNLHLHLHGDEIPELGVDLSDDLDVFLIKRGEVFDRRELDDARAEILRLKAVADKAEELTRSAKDSADRTSVQLRDSNTRGQALQLENVRLTTELMTLKTVLQTPDRPQMIEGN